MPANVGKMMYAGAVPWHGLGTKVETEQYALGALVKAGLDFEVGKARVMFNDPKGAMHLEYPGKVVLYRKDNLRPLGILGDSYNILQPKQCTSLLDAIVGETGAHYHTAGYLGNGEVIWFLIKLPGEIRVVKDDIVEKYLLIVNSYDGSYAVHVIETPIRVVCQNTMNAALNNAKAGFYQKHYQSMNFDVAQIRGQLGWVNDKFNVLEQAYQKMAKVQIDDATKKKYFEFVLNWPVKQEDVTAQFRNKMETLDYLFTEGRGQDNPEVKGSVWAGYNAVTEFVDYGFRKDTASRARSALMGAGSLIKSRAIDFALELIK